MIYSQIEDYSLSMRGIQYVMDSLQPHIFHTEIKVQKLGELCSILISYSPEKLFCKRQKLHMAGPSASKTMKAQSMLLTPKLLWLLRSQYIHSFFQYPTNIAAGNCSTGKGEHLHLIKKW